MELHLSLDKCYFLQLGYQNFVLKYMLNSHLIPPCNAAVNLSINVISILKLSAHCAQIVVKANAKARLILKLFLSRNPKLMSRAFIVYVQPLLEYCIQVQSPHNIGDIDLIEHIQRTSTRNLYIIRYCNL